MTDACKVGNTLPQIAVIIPVYNGAGHFEACLQALRRSAVPLECIVVDDGSEDNSAQIALSFGATVISTGGRRGPAAARNLGAASASAPILFFVDSDVAVHEDTAEMVLRLFEDQSVDAIIGSYDDTPAQTDFLSQYRNLLHHFTHGQGHREASTFWSGCGAIRRHVFLENEGFSESFERPAIEDIELGYRLKRNGHRIILDANLQVKHLKAWTFFGLLKTDVFDRGIPWTELILREAELPNDLNVKTGQRVSVALACLFVATAFIACVWLPDTFVPALSALLFLSLIQYEVEFSGAGRQKGKLATLVLFGIVAVSSLVEGRLDIIVCCTIAYLLSAWRHHYYPPECYSSEYSVKRVVAHLSGIYLLLAILYVVVSMGAHPLSILLVTFAAVMIALNAPFYRLLARKRGRLNALAAIPFLMLFHFYCGVAFAAGLIIHVWNRARRRFTVSRKVSL